MNIKTVRKLLALAEGWEAAAAAEVEGMSAQHIEHSREGLAASILLECAREVRETVTEAPF